MSKKNDPINVRDISKSKLNNIIWYKNPINSIKLPPLQLCSAKNNKNLQTLNKELFINKKKLNIKNNSLDMNSNNVRKNDIKKKLLHDKYSKIINSLDKNATLDCSSTQFITYDKHSFDKKKSLNNFLLHLTINNKKFNEAKLLFEDDNCTAMNQYHYPYFKKASQIPPLSKT